MMSTVRVLLFWNLFLLVNCDNLTVKTDSGQVRGVPQKTLVNKKEYISYRGIPYAKPPIGDLKFKVPVPISPWQDTLQATGYGNSCLVIYQANMLPSSKPKSEDCLYLNVFTPVTQSNKVIAMKAVMFFIHGGSFTEGDGTDGFYGPDFIVEDDVVLVTFNYRLGPWGFASFDLKGYTGNMGFKDQQMALEWVHRNIKYFGGDPNRITVIGESAGGLSTHLHMLSDKSRNLMNRAIAMSGTTFTHFGHYVPNNHIELFKDAFGLDAGVTGNDVLKFMLNATTELILEKTPASFLVRSLVALPFTAVIEDIKKAENPFLTRRPQEIYKTTNVNVPAMFGSTTAESLLLLDPTNAFYWLEPLRNYSNIGLPFDGLTLSPESYEYREAAQKIYKFYFGNRKLEPTVEILNIYIQMTADMNFIYPTYQALKLHSTRAKTFCYEDGLDLNLNGFKITKQIQHLKGMSHMEDLMYLFYPKVFAQLYDSVLANPDDPINRKTLAALEFSTKMFTDYAKTGSPTRTYFGRFTRFCDTCMAITNDGIKPVLGLQRQRMEFWHTIRESVKRWIVNPF